MKILASTLDGPDNNYQTLIANSCPPGVTGLWLVDTCGGFVGQSKGELDLLVHNCCGTVKETGKRRAVNLSDHKGRWPQLLWNGLGRLYVIDKA